MRNLEFLPLSQVEPELMSVLMDEEEEVWSSELGWDFSPIRTILASFIAQNFLPGYVAIHDGSAVGYAYFLIHRQKGILGTIYASARNCPLQVAETLLDLAIEGLKSVKVIRRIEAQIMPFNHTNLTAAFTRHGFSFYPRYFLELDLNVAPWRRNQVFENRIVTWDSSLLESIAEVLLISYRGGIDAEICDDYRTISECEGYLRSLIENPGCGVFTPEASFIGLDDQGRPGGFVLGSRISPTGGMIPQISITPSAQGRGMGQALMHHALSYFRSLGLCTVSLTVTKKNHRAFGWYQRLGFKIRKEFGAYLWERA